MNRVVCLFFYFFVIYVKTVRSQNYVGDNCVVGGTGAAGTCRLLQDCMSAIQALQSGIYPQTCGFQFNQPIVCCPGGSPKPVTPSKPPPITTTTTKTTTTRPATKPTPAMVSTVGPKNPVFLKVGDKAVQKCKEYGEYVNVIETPPVNIPGAKPYVRSDCGVVEVPLIVGGVVAKPKEFPHMALIGFAGENNEKKWQCGGSLISEEYVLTAAHCLYDKQ